MRIATPLDEGQIEGLRAGDSVRISGVLYVARDGAHARLVAAMDSGRGLPFDLRDQMIYYMGPSPARPGRPIGSAGPTSSYRMDPYTPALLRAGLKGMIGKGQRSPAVREALCRYRAIYLAGVGGVGALLAQSVRSAEVIAYPELGPEAVQRLDVADLPAIVINDIYGGDAYDLGKAAYRCAAQI